MQLQADLPDRPDDAGAAGGRPRHRAARGAPGRPLTPAVSAALDVGVSQGKILKWADAGDLECQHRPGGWLYHRDSVRARARCYWVTCRMKQDIRPAWLKAAG